MRVGNFSVLIPEGVEKDSGHVQMRHDQVYGIRLGNHGSVRCDAEVNVDGKHVGTFQMYSGQVFTLERPSHDTGRFTFYKANSEQGESVGAADVSTQERGLISVTFRPEKPRRILRSRGPSGQSMGSTEPDCNWEQTSSPIGFSSLEGTIKPIAAFPISNRVEWRQELPD